MDWITAIMLLALSFNPQPIRLGDRHIEGITTIKIKKMGRYDFCC